VVVVNIFHQELSMGKTGCYFTRRGTCLLHKNDLYIYGYITERLLNDCE
jgi:hypothetical protein